MYMLQANFVEYRVLLKYTICMNSIHCRLLDCAEVMVRVEITHSSSYILWLFSSFLRTLLMHPQTSDPDSDCTANNVINSRRAAPPWRHLIIEKRQETYSFFILLHSHPSSPPSLCLSSLLPSPVRLFTVQGGGVHVSGSGGSAALYCALVPLDITE